MPVSIACNKRGSKAMGYVSDNLMPGEEVVHLGKIHWFIYMPGAILMLLGILLLEIGVGIILMLVAFILWVRAALLQITVELAVTTKRVIAKAGLIRRDTIELNHNRVESLNVSQSIFGRMLDFGNITIGGTGGARMPIPSVADPLGFRRKAMEIIDRSGA
jgi:uncharacterized membrane protein YdbT with pleckstrin-like domain